MTDVLKIALDRREQLQAEIQRLDEFIRTAEQLIRASHPATRLQEETDHAGPARVNLLRRGSAAAG